MAIDGPSGAGKGTVARRVAERLGVPFLDTGSMYRALALRVLDRGIDPEDEAAVERIAREARIELVASAGGGLDVLLDGFPVEDRIRAPEVGEATSKISAYRAVRKRMVALQRACGRRLGGVVEGRDIGSKVFPETPFKFFVDARPEVRVDRRLQQLREAGGEVARDEVAREIASRDLRDRSRRESPLLCDESYRRIDTSNLSIEEVVELIVEAVEGGAAPREDRGRPDPGRE